MPHTPPRPSIKPPRRRPLPASSYGYSSKRYSPKGHNAVKKTTSKTARKATPFHCRKGFTSSSPAVTCVLATSTGVSSGSSNTGSNSSRIRACAEIADSAVPAIDTPRLPRKNTSSSWPKTRKSGRLYKIANTGSISSSVTKRKSVLAASLASKMEKGSLTESRNALSVSLVCSRKKHGCSISEAANRNASHRSPAPNLRDSVEVGSNVKLNSTITTRIKITVVISSSRERNSVRSSLPRSAPVLESRPISAAGEFQNGMHLRALLRVGDDRAGIHSHRARGQRGDR